MKLILFLLSLTASLASAADIVDIKDGPALAAHLCRLAPETEADLEGTLTIRHEPEGTLVIPFTSRTRLNSASWEVTYQTSSTRAAPAQRLTVTHFPDRPNTYSFSKAPSPDAPLGAPQQLGPTQIYMPFAHSDFWPVDLGLDFFHWPTQHLLRAQMRSGRPCKVLESIPAPEQRGAYGKILSWVDNETGGIILAEAYDHNGKRIKEFALRSFEKVEGQWQLQDMRIQDLKADSRTTLHFNLDRDN